jgi:hypothetical protein
VVADILSKWEKYEAHGINPDGGTWALIFKLFSFYDALDPTLSKTEQEFLFEQAFESVMLRRYMGGKKGRKKNKRTRRGVKARILC